MTKIKLSLLGLFVLFLSITIFISCSKGENEQISNSKKQHGTGLVDPVEFGKLHNIYLLKTLTFFTLLV
jgi:hypothetical protein